MLNPKTYKLDRSMEAQRYNRNAPGFEPVMPSMNQGFGFWVWVYGFKALEKLLTILNLGPSAQSPQALTGLPLTGGLEAEGLFLG